MGAKKITVVSPVYYGENTVVPLVEAINNHCKSIKEVSVDIILVDDSSPDKSWDQMRFIVKKEKNVRAIKLNKNYGQQSAIQAGLSLADGDYIVVMDCDLQDDPSYIPIMIDHIVKYPVVLIKKTHKETNYLKKIISYSFYKIFSSLTDIKHDGAIGNYGMYQRKVIKTYLDLNEANKNFPVLISWLAYPTKYIVAPQLKSLRGRSSYNIKSLLTLGISIIVQYSNKLLFMSIWLGILITFIAFIFSMLYAYLYFSGSITQPGYTSLILSVWILSGVIMAFIGILGIYLGSIFDNIRNRPHYVIDKIIGHD